MYDYNYLERIVKNSYVVFDDLKLNNLCVKRYEEKYPGDDSLRRLYNILHYHSNQLSDKYAWKLVPNGFEFYDNYQFDKKNKEFTYDIHLIAFENGEYVPKDKAAATFFDTHLQLIDILEDTWEQTSSKNSEFQDDVIADGDKSEHEDNILKMVNHVRKKLNEIADDDRYPYVAFIGKWLNRLNDTNASIDELVMEFFDDLSDVSDFLYRKYAYDYAYDENKVMINEFKRDVLELLEFYNPRGSAFSLRVTDKYIYHESSICSKSTYKKR